MLFRSGRAARLVEPDEMVPPLLWVVSREADGVNGHRFDANLWDPALPHFVLEFRDETSWALLPIPDRQASVDKGWHRTTPHELVEILDSAGAIKTESINGFFKGDE